MQRKIIFKDTEKQTELVLPVTPSSFRIDTGIKVETVNIHAVGDVNFPGYSTLSTISIDCMLPKRNYPFCNGSLLYPGEPYRYVEHFQGWAKSKTILRFVVSDTIVNMPVFVESIAYEEKDGTNDVYATIQLREHRELKAVKVETSSSTSRERESSEEQTKHGTETYTVKKGDTLSGICRKFYGDGSSDMYTPLAKLNGIKNPHLIYPGKVLSLPPKEQLI